MRQPFFVYLPTGVGSPGDSRYYQVITSPRTGHIQELPLRGVDLFKVTFVTNRFYALLSRYNIVITSNYRDGGKLQPLRVMH